VCVVSVSHIPYFLQEKDIMKDKSGKIAAGLILWEPVARFESESKSRS
jgi:hypothetical protein